MIIYNMKVVSITKPNLKQVKGGSKGGSKSGN